MSRLLYLFAGFPGKNLPPARHIHAGGLQHLIEVVEGLAVLEHDSAIQARREGLFVVSPSGYAEQTAELPLHLSDQLVQDGITDNWLNDNTTFGNGVACLKSSASYETKVVNHECGRTLEEILRTGEVVDLSRLRLQQVHNFTEGWGRYEYRWRSGACPQFTHQVFITTMLAKHELNAAAYRRILDVVEFGAQPKHMEQYSVESGKHFSEIRRWDGKPAFQGARR